MPIPMPRPLRRTLLAAAACLAAFGPSALAQAQGSYPSKPITLVSPYSVGGDAVASPWWSIVAWNVARPVGSGENVFVSVPRQAMKVRVTWGRTRCS